MLPEGSEGSRLMLQRRRAGRGAGQHTCACHTEDGDVTAFASGDEAGLQGKAFECQIELALRAL